MSKSSKGGRPDEYSDVIHSSGYGPQTARLYKFLTSRVIGQERAASRLARSFAIYHAGLKNPRKPINAVIFSGPTGVGKTMMAGEMAKFLIADRIKPPMTAIDCQMYTEHHQLSQLVGSPPGYVGYNDMPMLSQMKIDSYHFWIKFEQMVKKMKEGERPEDMNRFAAEMYKQLKPYISVVLLDEVEKAHATIHNALLGIVDKAEATMASPNLGVTDFSNSVIVMTCNIGGKAAADMLSGRKQPMGLRSPSKVNASSDAVDQAIYEQTLSMIQKFFPAEFVGRLRDQIVVFRSLPREKCRIVLENMLSEVQQLVNNGMSIGSVSGGVKAPPALLSYTQEFKDFLLDVGVSREYGLRPLEQAVKQHVVLELANAVEAGEIRPDDKVLFDIKSGRLEIRRKPRTQALKVVPPGIEDVVGSDRPTDPAPPPPSPKIPSDRPTDPMPPGGPPHKKK